MTPSITLAGHSSLGAAFRSALLDPNTPKILKDKLFLFIAQLRDSLPLEKALAVNAAEAEAVILAFVSPGSPESRPELDEDNQRDDSQQTFAELSKLVNSL